MDNREIYVGNLAWAATEDDLTAAFDNFGFIEQIKLIRDRETGKSRGFAFIRFRDKVGAEAALTMNGQGLAGRELRVRLATPKPPTDRRPRMQHQYA